MRRRIARDTAGRRCVGSPALRGKLNLTERAERLFGLVNQWKPIEVFKRAGTEVHTSPFSRQTTSAPGRAMPKHSTADQLRGDIDRGRTGDKVKVSDPPAAPLGTDDEAAGTPPSGEAVRQAREYERAIGRKVHGGVEHAEGASAAVRIYVAMVLALVALLSAGLWLAYRL